MTVVKCHYCKKMFPKEETEYVCAGPQYYHKECYEKVKNENAVIIAIHDKMKKLCGKQYNKQKIDAKIAAYKKMGFTVAGVKKALDYWYDIRKEDPTKAYGSIAIVEYIYGEAADYWYAQEISKHQYDTTDFGSWKNSLESEKIIVSQTVTQKPKRLKLFELD